MIDHTNMVYVEKKLSYRDWSDQVWSLTKTKQENNVIDPTSVVYFEKKLTDRDRSDWL